MLRPSPNHGTLRLPNDDDDEITLTKHRILRGSYLPWCIRINLFRMSSNDGRSSGSCSQHRVIRFTTPDSSLTVSGMAGRNGGDSDACTRLTMSTTHNTSSKLCIGKSWLDSLSINDVILSEKIRIVSFAPSQ